VVSERRNRGLTEEESSKERGEFLMVRTFAAAAALGIAGSALAVPQGAFWVEVPVVDNPADASVLAGFRSFDLFIQLEAGDVVFAMDSGIAGPNTGLSTTQSIFNHGFGGDAGVNPGFIGFFPDLAFDTTTHMGTLAFGSYGTPVGPWTWGAVITGVTSVNVPVPGSSSPDGSGAYHFARITLTSVGAFGEATAALGEYLGGQVFLSGTGLNGEFGGQIPATGVVNVPNAFVPTPGALALFGLAGAAAARRRR